MAKVLLAHPVKDGNTFLFEGKKMTDAQGFQRLSHIMTNLSSGFPTRSDIKQPVQPEIIRG